MRKYTILAEQEEFSESSTDAFAYASREIPEQPIGYRIAKRCFDVVAASVALVLLSPFFLLICILVRLDSKGPVIYAHTRYGKHGKMFRMLKFRTMCINAEDMVRHFTPEQQKEWQENFKLVNDPRITRVGRFLRKTSLDELPQLINIIRGDLSVVGPRPIVAEELEKYGEFKEKLLSVTPGLTGYWQAYARSNCSYQQRMAMELYYVDHASFWWDIRIIFATVHSVMRQHGAN